MMNTLVVALSHETLYTYVKRLTAIEACNKPNKGTDLDKNLWQALGCKSEPR
jgi:hypothetical protein